jgi:hypothetical protein
MGPSFSFLCVTYYSKSFWWKLIEQEKKTAVSFPFFVSTEKDVPEFQQYHIMPKYL